MMPHSDPLERVAWQYCDIFVMKVNQRHHCACHHSDEHSVDSDSAVTDRESANQVRLCHVLLLPLLLQPTLSHKLFSAGTARVLHWAWSLWVSVRTVFFRSTQLSDTRSWSQLLLLLSMLQPLTTCFIQTMVWIKHVLTSQEEGPCSWSVLTFWACVLPCLLQSMQSLVSLTQSAFETATSVTTAGAVNDHVTVKNLLTTREVLLPLVIRDMQLVSLMNEADWNSIFVSPDLSVSAAELHMSVPDDISVAMVSMNDAVRSSAQCDVASVQLPEPSSYRREHGIFIEASRIRHTQSIADLHHAIWIDWGRGSQWPSASSTPVAVGTKPGALPSFQPPSCRAPWWLVFGIWKMPWPVWRKEAMLISTSTRVCPSSQTYILILEIPKLSQLSDSSVTRSICRTGDVEHPQCTVDVSEGATTWVLVSINDQLLLFHCSGVRVRCCTIKDDASWGWPMI